MKLHELSGSRYTKKEDVPHAMVVTIVDVYKESFESPGEKPKDKPVIKVAELSKPIVTAPSNLDDIHVALGTTGGCDTSEWLGRKLVLWNDPNVMFQGKRTGGLRFKKYDRPGEKEVTNADRGNAEDLQEDEPT